MQTATDFSTTGRHLGFDQLAAETALSLKSELPGLQVVAVVPYRGQAERWNDAMKARYEALLHKSDGVIIISEHYFQGCFLRRNDFMVRHCSRLISWYDGKPQRWYVLHLPQSQSRRVESCKPLQRCKRITDRRLSTCKRRGMSA